MNIGENILDFLNEISSAVVLETRKYVVRFLRQRILEECVDYLEPVEKLTRINHPNQERKKENKANRSTMSSRDEEVSLSNFKALKMKIYRDIVKTQSAVRSNVPSFNFDRSQSQTEECTFCMRPRHSFEICRMLRLCLICGSDKHLMIKCPKRCSQWNPKYLEPMQC